MDLDTVILSDGSQREISYNIAYMQILKRYNTNKLIHKTETDSRTWKESYDQPRQHIKKQRHYFINKGPSSQGYGFSSGHVWM